MSHALCDAITQLLHDWPETLPGIAAAASRLPPDATADPRAEPFRFAAGPPNLAVIYAGRHILVVDVQLRVDPAKKFDWPVYVALARFRLGGPARMVVVTPSARVEKWAAAPIAIGEPDELIRPIVVGPQAVPRVTHLANALAQPGVAILSAVLHARSPAAVDVAVAALHAAGTLPLDQQCRYTDLILGRLSADAMTGLADHLQASSPALALSAAPTAPQNWLYLEAWTLRRAKALAMNLAQIRALAPLRQTLRNTAVGRSIALLVAAETRMVTCADCEVLNRWIALARTARDSSAIFDPTEGPPPPRRP